MRLSALLLLIATSAWAELTEYKIECAYNDELFVINGEKYSAQTFCLGWETGQAVKFIEGSPWGACASATQYNVQLKDTCEVWCD